MASAMATRDATARNNDYRLDNCARCGKWVKYPLSWCDECWPFVLSEPEKMGEAE